MSNVYNAISKSSNKFNERNDCTVKAVSIVCGKTYNDSHTACAKLGRTHGKGMKSGVVLQVIESLKYTCTPITLTRKYTVRTITQICNKDKKYVAFVNGHILAITDKNVDDWTAGRKHVIESLYEITSGTKKLTKFQKARQLSKSNKPSWDAYYKSHNVLKSLLGKTAITPKGIKVMVIGCKQRTQKFPINVIEVKSGKLTRYAVNYAKSIFYK